DLERPPLSIPHRTLMNWTVQLRKDGPASFYRADADAANGIGAACIGDPGAWMKELSKTCILPELVFFATEQYHKML
ncbi:MAG: hypothetical protein WCP20_15930, partial [Desulfuromonadales bacterium]